MHLTHKQLKNCYIWRIKSCIFCFNQLPLNIKHNLEFSFHLIDGGRLLWVVVGVVSLSVDKPLDFYDITSSVLNTCFKVQ